MSRYEQWKADFLTAKKSAKRTTEHARLFAKRHAINLQASLSTWMSIIGGLSLVAMVVGGVLAFRRASRNAPVRGFHRVSVDEESQGHMGIELGTMSEDDVGIE